MGDTGAGPAASRNGGRAQAPVSLDANDLPGGLAHQGCAVVDSHYPVALGQLGHASALLMAELYDFHALSSIVGRSTGAFERGPRFHLCSVPSGSDVTYEDCENDAHVVGAWPTVGSLTLPDCHQPGLQSLTSDP